MTKLKVHTPGLVTKLAGATLVFTLTDPVFADPQSMRLISLWEYFQIFFPPDLSYEDREHPRVVLLRVRIRI